MAEEIKKIVCGGCAHFCPGLVRVEDGKVVEQFLPKMGESPMEKAMHTGVMSCPRARSIAEVVDHPQRVNYPLKRIGQRGENKWERVTWDEALDDIASNLKQVKDQYGAEALGISNMGLPCSGIEYSRRFANLFGTPTFFSQGQECFSASATLGATIIGGLEYFPMPTEQTKCVVLMGVNPRNTYRHIWYQLQEFKKSGMKMIVIDPRVSESAAMADLHLQLQPGTDAALLLGMLNVIIKEGLYDSEFVEKYCYGFDKLAERVEDYPPEKVAQITGLSAENIIAASRMYATSKPAIIFNGMGIEQIPNPGPPVHARYLLPAITGNIDIPGGQVFMTSHRTVGLMVDVECADALPPEQKAKLIGSKQFPLFSSWDTFETIYTNLMKVNRPFANFWIGGQGHSPSVWRAMLTGKPHPLRALIVETANPLVMFPNSKLVYEAMKSLDFHVNMDIFMTPSALMADYVLPAASYLEKPFMSPTDFFHYCQCGDAAIDPLYERKPEYYLWRELGLRLGQKEDWPWETIEDAFEDRLSSIGMTFKEAVMQPGLFSEYEYKRHEKVGFGTPTGKVELYSTTLEKLGFDPLPSWEEWPWGPTSELAKEYPMSLISSRDRVYMHSQNRQTPSVRKKCPDPKAELNPNKAEEMGIKNGDWIWVETQLGRARFKCELSSGMLPNVVNAQFGWWFPEDPAEEPSLHGLWRSNLNAILPDEPEMCDQATGIWPLRAIMCKVYKE